MYQRSVAADKGLEELYAGVGRVLAALQNYSIAFEALNGMTRKYYPCLLTIVDADLLYLEQVEEALEGLKGVR
jgi:hypothetical protein